MKRTDQALVDLALELIEAKQMTLIACGYRDMHYTEIDLTWNSFGLHAEASREVRGNTIQSTLYQPSETVWTQVKYDT